MQGRIRTAYLWLQKRLPDEKVEPHAFAGEGPVKAHVDILFRKMRKRRRSILDGSNASGILRHRGTKRPESEWVVRITTQSGKQARFPQVLSHANTVHCSAIAATQWRSYRGREQQLRNSFSRGGKGAISVNDP